jgi:hypothetical protein
MEMTARPGTTRPGLKGLWALAPQFLRLRWREFHRSASFGKGLVVQVLLVISAGSILLLLATLGLVLVPLVQKELPGQAPFPILCGGALFWFAAELAMRQMMESPPGLAIRNLLALPVARDTMAHFLLIGRLFTFYTLALLIFLLPLAAVLYSKGAAAWSLAGWCLGLLLSSVLLGQLNILLGRQSWGSLALPVAIVLLGVAQWFQWIDLVALSRRAGLALYHRPLLALVPLALCAMLYAVNFRLVRKSLRLDDLERGKGPVATTSGGMAWAGRFGSAAPFLRMDFRLIMRNKRPRTQVLFAPLIIVYMALIGGMGHEMETGMRMYLAFFITGMLAMSFGQYIPGWDGSYYPLLMVRGRNMGDYLRAKAILLAMGVAALAFLSVPLAIMDPQWLIPVAATAIYHIGITVPLILFFGSYSRKSMELNTRAFANYQGVGASQFLMAAVILFPPVLAFTILWHAVSLDVAMVATVVIGLMGILLRDRLMRSIVRAYAAKKHAMLAGFGENRAS